MAEPESCRTYHGGVRAGDDVPLGEDGRALSELAAKSLGTAVERPWRRSARGMVRRRKKRGDSKWIRLVFGVDLVQFGVGSGCRVRRGGRARAPPYPPHIWAGYEGCRSARAFEARLRRPSGSDFRDQSVIGRAVRAFQASSRCPAVEALTF